MRLIDRLNRYLERKDISPYAFEKACGVANGYLGKQSRGKGSVGSEILEKISVQYPDLNLVWLITGKGRMIVPPGKNKYTRGSDAQELKEEEAVYSIRNKLAGLLREHLHQLESFPGNIRLGRRKKQR